MEDWLRSRRMRIWVAQVRNAYVYEKSHFKITNFRFELKRNL